MTGLSEQIIQESGCGKFQIVIVFLVNILGKQPVVFSAMFMTYGIYNPGWQCLDETFDLITNLTNNNNNKTEMIGNASFVSTNYTASQDDAEESCQLFKSCSNVRFNTGISTIVTQWGLLCEKAWVPALIISVQMAGIVVGNIISGQLGDTFGRKNILYGSTILIGVFNLCSIFSPNWEIFIVLRFFMGLAIAAVNSLQILLPAEFLTPKWRGRMAAIPSWHIGGILFSLTAMWFEDWKIMHIAIAVMCVICVLPVLWVPESLRWLEVKQKQNEFKDVVRKIAKFNKQSMNKLELTIVDAESQPSMNPDHEKRYTIRDIFRRGYRRNTIILGVLFFFTDIGYFGISFGTTSLYGNIYINLVLMFGMEVPFSFLTMNAPNVFGRRNGSFCFFFFATIFMFMTAAIEVWTVGDVKRIGTLIFAILAKTIIHAAWYVLLVLAMEIYPTCVRSIGTGYIHTMTRLGGTVAPFFIPSDKNSIYLSYLAMGILGSICCTLFLTLPETKGKQMKDYFSDELQEDENL